MWRPFSCVISLECLLGGAQVELLTSGPQLLCNATRLYKAIDRCQNACVSRALCDYLLGC